MRTTSGAAPDVWASRNYAGHWPGCEDRPRLAILSTWHPEPVDNGRKQRTRQMIAALAEVYEIVLISLLAPSGGCTDTLPVVRGVRQQHSLPLPVFAPRSLLALAASFHPLPRSVVVTWQRDTAEHMVRILRQARVKVAIGTDLRTLRYLLALDPGVITLLDEPDVSPFTAQAIADARGLSRIRALGRRRKYTRLLRAGTCRLAAAIVASLGEAHAYRELAGPARVEVIENGIGALPEPAWRAPLGADIVYAGSLTYQPNAEAVAYFVGEILPRVVREIPNARLLVTGKLPVTLPPGVMHKHVKLTDWLDNQALDATYRQSRACAIPLISGTGTRIKVLEALGYGIPVISTTKGVEGLNLTPDVDFLCADTPADFAAATVRLLTDTPFAEALGACGRERVRREYTWESRGRQLRDLVRECLERAPQRRA